MSRDSKVSVSCSLWGTALAVLTMSLPAHAGDADPAKLLERMSQASHALNYQGTFIYAHGNNILSVRIIHGVDDKGEHERLLTLSGKSREVIRDNDEVTCIQPDDQSISVEHPGPRHAMPLIVTPDVQKISGNYQILVRGSERIAGRLADQVAVVPKDHYRYGHAYWIDQASGLLLRADLINGRGRVVEQMMFTSLTLLDAFPAKSLEPETTTRKSLPQVAPAEGKAEENVPEEGRWMAKDLPPGFELELLSFHPMPGKKAPVEHHVYSDGLASVSVFIEPEEHDESEFLGHSLMGAVHAFARVIDGSRITVVGEVPAVTVEHIADSMHQRQE
jgi:sigma-E factor negative regulatory protein RseB